MALGRAPVLDALHNGTRFDEPLNGGIQAPVTDLLCETVEFIHLAPELVTMEGAFGEEAQDHQFEHDNNASGWEYIETR